MRVFGGLLSRVFSKVSKRTFTRAGGGRRFLYSTSREQKTVVVDGTTVVPQQSALDSLSSSAFLIDWTFQHNTHFYTFCTKEKFLPQFFFFFALTKKGRRRPSLSLDLSLLLSFIHYGRKKKKKKKKKKTTLRTTLLRDETVLPSDDDVTTFDDSEDFGGHFRHERSRLRRGGGLLQQPRDETHFNK